MKVYAKRLPVMLTKEELSKAVEDAHLEVVTRLSETFEKYLPEAILEGVSFDDDSGLTIVKLAGNHIGTAKCSKSDVYDRRVGFCVAYMNALFGSKTRVKKVVDEYGKIDGE